MLKNLKHFHLQCFQSNTLEKNEINLKLYLWLYKELTFLGCIVSSQTTLSLENTFWLGIGAWAGSLNTTSTSDSPAAKKILIFKSFSESPVNHLQKDE